MTSNMIRLLSVALPVFLIAPWAAAQDPVQRSIEGISPVTTASGLKYYDLKVGTGEEPKSGARVNVHYSGWDTGGKLFDSSVKRGSPFAFNTDRGVIKGWIEGVKGMKVGGIRRLEIPADLAYGKGKDLIFEVELLSIEKQGAGVATSQGATSKEAAPKKDEKPKVPDPVQTSIEGLNPVTTASGLKYYVLKEGEGEVPRSGASVKTHYSGWLTDGTLFDTSANKGRPFSFKTNGGVIEGWLEAISTMKVGEKRRLEIPPDLAYGDQQKGQIPPNSTLIFEMELVSIDKNGPERLSIEGLKEVKTESGLKYWVVKEGTGDTPGPKGRVKMHASGWLKESGRLVGTTREGTEPLRNNVSGFFPGWSEAAADMKTGEIRHLEIPSDLAYGEKGTRGVPPNSELIMDVEMVEVLPEIKQTSTNGIAEVTLESGTKYWDLKVGDGEEVKSDSNCVANYTGWLLDGTMFDSSFERGKPHTFSMVRGVIEGWKEGLIGMKAGGKRRLQIPPEKAYGSRPRGRLIPANSVLVFEVEMLEVTPPPPALKSKSSP
ncbi:MAG: hypothetical protein GXP29_02345 [Planctomycetes bacterium]|nr:hypothetical protein [Planctomycetota bacterium]